MHAFLRPATWICLAFMTATAHSEQVPTTQRQYQLQKSGDALALRLVDAPVVQPGENEVLVRVRATSLNRRDIYVKQGAYGGSQPQNLVPLSDGAGEVVATGSKVKRFRKGDRVASIFFQLWLEGRPKPQYLGSALGGGVNGMLSQYVTLNEN